MPDIRNIKGYVPFKEILKDPEGYARKFSEGNRDLYNLLLECWKMGLETFSCASGIEGEDWREFFYPHIMIGIPHDKKDIIYNLLKIVYVEYNSVIVIEKDFKYPDLLCIKIESRQDNSIFRVIDEVLTGSVNNKDERTAITNATEVDTEEIKKIVELVNNSYRDMWRIKVGLINNNMRLLDDQFPDTGLVYKAEAQYALSKDGGHPELYNYLEVSKRLSRDEIKGMDRLFNDEDFIEIETKVKRKPKQLIR